MDLLERIPTFGNRYLKEMEEEKLGSPANGVYNSLRSRLIVSLTTFSARFNCAHLTIQSIIEQTIVPDAIIVWISDSDFDIIPDNLRRLSRFVHFKKCQDVRSYKKLVYSKALYPDAYIVTADDDVYYHRKWLQSLVEAVRYDYKEVICHVAYRTHFTERNVLAPFMEWTRDVQDAYSRCPSRDLVPLGFAGILYPPGCFHTDALERGLYETICPDGDDLWFHCMAKLANIPTRKIGPRFKHVLWPGSQTIALWRRNNENGNDKCVKNLCEKYGSSVFE